MRTVAAQACLRNQATNPIEQTTLNSAFLFTPDNYGRGGGVERCLGVGANRGVAVTLGVGVAVAVPLGVAVAVGVLVAVAVGVAVEVTVAVGVAVGVVPSWSSKEPISMRPFTTLGKPGPR
jgi:hypothetical protein